MCPHSERSEYFIGVEGNAQYAFRILAKSVTRLLEYVLETRDFVRGLGISEKQPSTTTPGLGRRHQLFACIFIVAGGNPSM